MNNLLSILILSILASFAIAGSPPGHPTVNATDKALHEGGGGGGGGGGSALPNLGKVLEVINSGGYTYLHVEENDQKRWIASNQVAAKEGDLVSFTSGNVMHDFHSKSLNRTFPEILFTAKIQVEGAHPTPSSMPAAPAAPSAGMEVAASQNQGQVISTINSGGYTYIEVDQGGKTLWLAAPQVTVKTGDTVSYADGSVMKNFYSKTLKREFKEVIFLGGVQVVGK